MYFNSLILSQPSSAYLTKMEETMEAILRSINNINLVKGDGQEKEGSHQEIESSMKAMRKIKK